MSYNVDFYREYAKGFWTEINDVFSMRIPKHNYLPIVFEELTKQAEMESIYGFTHTHQNERTKLNSLYPVVYLRDDRSAEELKETIRHEIIHYYLGLHYFKYQDNTAMFWLLSDLFSGGAYVELGERERQIYNIVKGTLNNLFQKYNMTDDKNKITTKLSLILCAVDDYEVNSDKKLSGLELVCRACSTIL